MNEDDRVKSPHWIPLRAADGESAEWLEMRDGRFLEFEGRVKRVDPHREAIKAQVRRAVLLDPRWKAPTRATDEALRRVAAQLAAKRRAR